MNLLKRFYIYQDERFPLKYLAFTTFAVVISSAAILSFEVSIIKILASYFSGLFFIFHIRVIDESRDYKHDVKYHPKRPIPRGLISIKELMFLDFFGLSSFLFISIFYGIESSIYGSILLIFSFFAWKDFFLSEEFKKNHFYVYNSIHMIQMVLLQLFVYVIFTNDFTLNKVMIIHLLFVIFNTIILEFIRKIKTDKDESKGKDTYSWHLGYKKSLYIFYAFNILNVITFIWMLYSLSPNLGWYGFITLIFFGILSLALFRHLKNKNKNSELFLMVATISNYICLNFLVYFYSING